MNLKDMENEINSLKLALKKAEIDIDKLRKERRANTTPDRQLINRIRPEVFSELFCWDVDKKSGEIIEASCKDKISEKVYQKIFMRFWRGIMIAFKHNSCNDSGSSSNFNAAPCSLQSLSDNEYEVFATLINDISERIILARKSIINN